MKPAVVNISTTQVVSSAIMGVGATKRLNAVRWGVAGNIVVAWIVMLPAAAGIGALTYAVTRLFGTGAAGPLVVSVLIVIGSIVLFSKRAQEGSPPAAPAEA